MNALQQSAARKQAIVRRRLGPISRLADGGAVEVSRDASGTTSFSGGNVSGAPSYSGGASPAGGGTVSSIGPSPDTGPSAATTSMNKAADIYASMAAGPGASAAAPAGTAGAAAMPSATPTPMTPQPGVQDNSKVDLRDPSYLAQRNASSMSALPSSTAASRLPSAVGATGAASSAPAGPIDIRDPAFLAQRNASSMSVLPNSTAASRLPSAVGAMGSSSASRRRSPSAPQPVNHFSEDGTFMFADGGQVPGTVSPYSIKGIASGVAAGYNAARDATATGFEKLHATFGRPTGYVAAMATPPAPAPAAQPAPVQAAPAGTVGGAIGAIQAHQKELAELADGGVVRGPRTRRGPITHLASGGIIRGPGTGTSDSIPATMAAGSYVVPKDSTDTMQQVRVSNGETALTPADVHALGTAALNVPGDPHGAGTAALDVLRQITHRNVHAARGRANGGPIRRLADGGDVENKIRTTVVGPIGSRLSDQIPGYDSPVPPADGSNGTPAAAGTQAPLSTGGATGSWAGPAPAAAPAQAAPPATALGDAAAPGPITRMVNGAPGVVMVSAPGASPLYTNVPGTTPASMTLGPVSPQNQEALDNLSAKYDTQARAGAAMMGPSAAARGDLPGLTGAWIPGINAPASQSVQELAARNQKFDQDEAKKAALRGGHNAVNLLNNENTTAAALTAAGMTTDAELQRAQMDNATRTQLQGPLTAIQVQEAGQKLAQGQQAIAAQKAYQDALVSGDPKAIDTAEMALRGQTGHLPLRYETGAGGTLGTDVTHNVAVQYLNGDHSVLSSLGGGAMGAMNRAAVLQAVTEEMKARGYGPEQVNAIRLNFVGDQAGATTAGKRATQMDMAAGEAANVLQLVRQYSANVPRSQFQPLNKALNAYRTNTGDPATVQFGASLNALVNTYSRAISPTGTPTVNDKQHAEDLLSAAQTPEQTEAVLKVMEAEIGAARHATADVRQGIAARNGAPPTQPAGGGAGVPQPAVLSELRRRAANDPALASRLQKMGY